jgi:uncharacterized protein YjbI with pentapeptide repeats
VCSPRVTLGAIDKSVVVVGDRWWRDGAATEPLAFSEMPIRWERAFGGAGFEANPVGKGAAPVATEEGEVHPLPNIEHPEHLVGSPEDRPPSAGFGSYDIRWPQRSVKAGTYDEAWMRERYPGFPRDLDWGVFNAAPEDQQVEGYFRGDEGYSITEMHPSRARIEGRLPGIRARVFVTQRPLLPVAERAGKAAGAEKAAVGESRPGDAFREVEMRLDTVHLFPHRERGVLVFHGAIEVAEDDAADIAHLVLACENLGESRPVEHYKAVLAERLDRSRASLAILRDADLVPARKATSVSAEEAAERALFAHQGLVRKHLRRRLIEERERARQRAAALGLDPSMLGLPEIPPEEPAEEELPAFVEKAAAEAEAEQRLAEARRVEREREARAKCAAQGLDYDKVMREARSSTGGPPKFSASEELAKMREASRLAKARGISVPELEAALADPGLEDKLHAQEKQLRDAYRRTAHEAPPGPALDREAAAALRREVEEGARAGKSFAGRDLTGADLSGLALAGADFREAMLEGASLAGADLREAVFADAVLARADLTGTRLAKATLAGANLGGAKLNDAAAEGADLTGIILVKADLSGARFTGAKLGRADLSEAIFRGADLSGVHARESSFVKTDLTGAKLAGADFGKANFLESNIAGLDFTGAKLVATVLLAAKADRAVFREADLSNLRAVHGTSLAGADFRGARLEQANLRFTALAGADFRGACLRGADLSESDLRGAQLHKADAAGARFVRADLTGADLRSVQLMEGSLSKAVLAGANLGGSNLFRVDFSGARTDDATSFAGAHTKRLRVVAPRANRGDRPASWPLPLAPEDPRRSHAGS